MRTAAVQRVLTLTTKAVRRWRGHVLRLAEEGVAKRMSFEAWVEGCALAASTVASAEVLFRKKKLGWVSFAKWAALIERVEGMAERLELRAAAVRAKAHRRSALMTTTLMVWLDSTTENISRREKSFQTLSPSMRSTVRRNKS